MDLGGDVAAGVTVTLTAPGDLAEVALDVQMVRQGVGPVPANLRLPVTTPPLT